MRVSDILKRKPADMHWITAGSTLVQAAAAMIASRVGALIVGDANQLAGLVSERELTRELALFGADAHRHHVVDVMIRNPMVAQPTDELMDLIATMTRLRTRHVPIVDKHSLVGILSIGDLLKFRLNEKTQENLILQDIARWHPEV